MSHSNRSYSLNVLTNWYIVFQIDVLAFDIAHWWIQLVFMDPFEYDRLLTVFELAQQNWRLE